MKSDTGGLFNAILMYVSENGDFLALDLGGTNFRVLLCRMRDGHCESISRNYNVPNYKLYGPAAEVFLFKLHVLSSVTLYLGHLINKLQNGAIPLILKIRSIHFVGNLILEIHQYFW